VLRCVAGYSYPHNASSMQSEMQFDEGDSIDILECDNSDEEQEQEQDTDQDTDTDNGTHNGASQSSAHTQERTQRTTSASASASAGSDIDNPELINGWWLARKSDGTEGYVPKTFMQVA